MVDVLLHRYSMQNVNLSQGRSSVIEHVLSIYNALSLNKRKRSESTNASSICGTSNSPTNVL
jgi:hypothetical protein